MILWKAIDMNAAIEPLKAEGDRVREEDAVWWSPLSHEHINRLAQSPFTLDNGFYQEYRTAQTQDMVARVARLGCARGLAGSGAHFG